MNTILTSPLPATLDKMRPTVATRLKCGLARMATVAAERGRCARPPMANASNGANGVSVAVETRERTNALDSPSGDGKNTKSHNPSYADKSEPIREQYPHITIIIIIFIIIIISALSVLKCFGRVYDGGACRRGRKLTLAEARCSSGRRPTPAPVHPTVRQS